MKRAFVLFADGFEEVEALTVVDIMRRANIECKMVSITGSLHVTGSHGIQIKADMLVTDDLKNYDMLVLPGGMPGAKNLKENEGVISLVKHFDDKDKFIAAICAAPIVFGKAEVLQNVEATCYPGFENELKGAIIVDKPVVKFDNVITSKGPGTGMDFAYTLIELLGYEDVEEMKKSMIYSK